VEWLHVAFNPLQLGGIQSLIARATKTMSNIHHGQSILIQTRHTPVPFQRMGIVLTMWINLAMERDHLLHLVLVSAVNRHHCSRRCSMVCSKSFFLFLTHDLSIFIREAWDVWSQTLNYCFYIVPLVIVIFFVDFMFWGFCSSFFVGVAVWKLLSSQSIWNNPPIILCS